MVGSLTVKPLILALLVSLSFNGLFGYLSYKFHSDKAVAEKSLEQALKTNQSLVKSAENSDKACKVSDGITSEFKREEGALESHTDAIVDRVDKLPKLPKSPAVATKDTNVAKEATKNEETDIAGIDDLLPDSLRMLTDEAFNSVQRQANPNTR